MQNKYRNRFGYYKYWNDSIYLDSAATTLKPLIIGRFGSYLSDKFGTNPHRGLYEQSYMFTNLLEKSLILYNKIINDTDSKLLYTRGTTESINIIAYSICSNPLNKGKKIVLSKMNHNSNILPWLEFANKFGLVVEFLDVNIDGSFSYDKLNNLSSDTVIFSYTACSNVNGETVDPKLIASLVEDKVLILSDIAQSISHSDIKPYIENSDYAVFSSHKIYGNYGLGGIFYSERVADMFERYGTGGGAVNYVGYEGVKYRELINSVIGGTVNPVSMITSVVGLISIIYDLDGWSNEDIENAIIYSDTTSEIEIPLKDRMVSNEQRPCEEEKVVIGSEYSSYKKINIYELKRGMSNLYESVSEIYVSFYKSLLKNLREEIANSIVIKSNTPIISIYSPNIHTHDIATALADEHIACRSGYHCASYYHESMKIGPTTRFSLGVYNIDKEAEVLGEKLNTILLGDL